ncbi:MAG: hypothetical protein QM756_35410 [Polyangiaceae bacterium]
MRDGSQWLDGCGINLVVNQWTGACFTGSWGAWGVIHDGFGVFELAPSGRDLRDHGPTEWSRRQR